MAQSLDLDGEHRVNGEAADSLSPDTDAGAQTALPLPNLLDEEMVVRPKAAEPHAPEAKAPAEPASIDPVPLEPGRALTVADFAPPRTGPIDASIRLAYRLGVPGSVLAAPFRKAAAPRILATVEGGVPGDRARGVAMRAGHFLVNGVKAPIAQMDFASSTRLTPPFARVVHGFAWLRDLAASAPREQCIPVAERVFSAWLKKHRGPAKTPAWTAEFAGQRLLAWLIHAPLILSDATPGLRTQGLEAISDTAKWLDRNVSKAEDRLGAVHGWCGVVAAGLLLPDGKPRRLYGESGLLRTLGEAISDDGGVLSRSPMAQMDAIAVLTDLRSCYEAVDEDPPKALETMLALLVPPLLALRHTDGGLGSWQGSGAVGASELAGLIEASRVRTRPAKDMRQWGYQNITADKTVLQFDAAPPPRTKHARFGCASTLAFEMSSGGHRLIVNCGGAALAGGQTPVRIEQGLRGTAAHSTLALDEANSTAVHIKGQIGKGVEEVDITRGEIATKTRTGKRVGTKLEATHDGYSTRYGLIHRRILILSDDGGELRGEDVLEPSSKRGKRGKIAYAIRFHIGRGIDLGLSEDKRGAGLALPDGSYWQFRLGTSNAGLNDDAQDDAKLSIEESIWIDGEGRPHPIEQLVVEGLASRSGGSFPWILKKMG
ncbi:heparinase II/III family protein [Erythrobacter sp. W53]|uniref:heparinase II/III family protein n=1 Tax=Erythrobacter sp. W53 TaxID=3425947 RepID=UPI003D7668B2